MATVTRTLKKGTDTGKLDRAEVRAVTAAIRAGRTADVLSGAVLQQFKAKKNGASTKVTPSKSTRSARGSGNSVSRGKK